MQNNNYVSDILAEFQNDLSKIGNNFDKYKILNKLAKWTKIKEKYKGKIDEKSVTNIDNIFENLWEKIKNKDELEFDSFLKNYDEKTIQHLVKFGKKDKLKNIDHFIENRINYFTNYDFEKKIVSNIIHDPEFFMKINVFLEWLGMVSKWYDISFHKLRLDKLMNRFKTLLDEKKITKPEYNNLMKKRKKISFTGKNKFKIDKEHMVYGDIDKELIKNCSTLKEEDCDGVCLFNKTSFWNVMSKGKCEHGSIKDIIFNTFCSKGSYKKKQEIINIIKSFTYDPELAELRNDDSDKKFHNTKYKNYYTFTTKNAYADMSLRRHSFNSLCELLKEILEEIFSNIEQKTVEQFAKENNLDVNTVIQSRAIINEAKKENLGFQGTFNRLWNFLRANKTYISFAALGGVCIAILFYLNNMQNVTDVFPTEVSADLVENTGNAVVDEALNLAKEEGYSLTTVFGMPAQFGIPESVANFFNEMCNIIKGYLSGIIPGNDFFIKYMNISFENFSFEGNIKPLYENMVDNISSIYNTSTGKAAEMLGDIFSVEMFAEAKGLPVVEEIVSLDNINVVETTSVVEDIVGPMQQYYNGEVDLFVKVKELFKIVQETEGVENVTYYYPGSDSDLICNVITGTKEISCKVVEVTPGGLGDYFKELSNAVIHTFENLSKEISNVVS